jgi:hypothetical protein
MDMNVLKPCRGASGTPEVITTFDAVGRRPLRPGEGVRSMHLSASVDVQYPDGPWLAGVPRVLLWVDEY